MSRLDALEAVVKGQLQTYGESICVAAERRGLGCDFFIEEAGSAGRALFLQMGPKESASLPAQLVLYAGLALDRSILDYEMYVMVNEEDFYADHSPALKLPAKGPVTQAQRKQMDEHWDAYRGGATGDHVVDGIVDHMRDRAPTRIARGQLKRRLLR